VLQNHRIIIGRRMPLEINEILNGRYRIEDVLGQGGMGAVYKALDINLGVPVAVKENLFITEEYARQFRREASILAGLRHPNLPRVTDHFVLEGEGQYLVMDFVDGVDLRERLEASDVVSEAEALPWFLEICDALAYLHSLRPPIIHRDIKPGNIKITPDDRAILVDFGLAKVDEGGNSTTTGAKAMTPGFSPPEQYGTGPTDARTDVYSLAATLYAAVTGAIPEDALERAMGREKLTPLQHWNPSISVGVARAVEKALSVSPDDRYQSITQFAAALGAASSSGMTTVSRPLPYLEPTRRAKEYADTASLRTRVETVPPRRKRWPILAALLGSVVIIAVAVVVGRPFIEDRLGELLETPSVTIPTQTDFSQEPTQAVSTELAFNNNPTETEMVLIPSPEEPIETATEESTLEPTPAATPMGGGVGQIAFASIRDGDVPQIYLINIDGTGLQALTSLQDGACQPAWSPDGSQLLFISPCRDNREQYPGSSIWLLSLDELEPRQLPTTPGGGDFDPAWHPNGESYAFTSLRDGWAQIYVTSLDGTDLRGVSDGYEPDSQPAWDPRGTNLLFTGIRGADPEIMLMSEIGGNEQQFSMADSQGHTHADWSNGEFILFERKKGDIPRLVVKGYGERTREANQVCVEGQRASQPMAEGKWSPDTLWIVFETWPDGTRHDIAVMSSSCTGYALLTEDAFLDFDPAWRP
jgi:serine/threonine protein kinase/Tol biopolymer transport system component